MMWKMSPISIWPILIYYSPASPIVELATGMYHNCALRTNGALVCWGSNVYGQLGIGKTAAIGDGPNEMGKNLTAVDLGTGELRHNNRYHTRHPAIIQSIHRNYSNLHIFQSSQIVFGH